MISLMSLHPHSPVLQDLTRGTTNSVPDVVQEWDKAKDPWEAARPKGDSLLPTLIPNRHPLRVVQRKHLAKLSASDRSNG